MQDLLFLSHRIPYPPDKGDKIRAWHILRHLMRSHRVHVGCFADDEADWAHVPALREQCAGLACVRLHPRWQKLRALSRLRPGRPLTLNYFDNPGMRRWVRDTVARHDIRRVFVSCSAMAPYVLDMQRSTRILDFIDVDSSKWTDYASGSAWPMRAVWAREGRTLLDFERQIAGKFDHALFVSDAEQGHFHALAPEAVGRTSAMSNGVDFHYFSPVPGFEAPFPPDPRAIVFTGAMDYRPNIDAVVWFATEVLPRLRAGTSPPAFWIVGANPSDEVRRLTRLGGIHVTGRVADTRPFLAHAAVAVAPLRIARGIQNKVLEAMAMARPVVATPQAFEGLAAEPGQDLLLAATPEDMARRIEEVLAGRHPTLGENARRLVKARYDWLETLAPLDTVWRPEQAVAVSAAIPLAQTEVVT